MHDHSVRHHWQKRISITFSARNELGRERVEHVRLLQLHPVQHCTERRPSDAEERVMRMTDFDETFPQLPTFPDRAKCDGITDDGNQTLGSRDCRVQQLCVRQEAEVQIRHLFLTLSRRVTRFSCSNCRKKDCAKLRALNVENSFDRNAEKFSFSKLTADSLDLKFVCKRRLAKHAMIF